MSKKSTKKQISYSQIDAFDKATLPVEIEDEILGAYSVFATEEQDMKRSQVVDFFNMLKLPKDLYHLVHTKNLCIEGTDIVDFERLLKDTYYLLIYMDNIELIDDLWALLVHSTGRDERYPNVQLRNHILSVKELQKSFNYCGIDQTREIVEMVAVATDGERVYMDYLDFARILGRLGLLRM